MFRTPYAATLALALLSLTAVEAAASPVSSFARTYTLQCSAGLIKNTSGRVIPKGTQIRIVYNNGYFGSRIVSVSAYRDVNINETIPMGNSSVYPHCTATATIWPRVSPIVSKTVRR